MHLCTIYGIVIIEIYSCNKEVYTYTVALYPSLYCLSVQRLGKLKTSIVYHGAYIYIYIYMQHLTPRQLEDSFTHSTAICNMGVHWGSQN